MFGLVDGNNFYASCERVFQPALRGKPLVVLSNNDGCAIARSAEAKALGIKMGQPAHELKHPVRHHGLQLRSANFGLYADLSGRVVSVLRDAAPRVEVYSIDESFIDLDRVQDRERFARELRARFIGGPGIPNCIGIGPKKTLAKLANKAAKSADGVVDLGDPLKRDELLRRFPVDDLWGVGRRLAPKLICMGIRTAAGLRDAPPDDTLATFGVTLARTQRELQGHACMELQEVGPDRQQIMVSRSFADWVADHEAIAQALATFCGPRLRETARTGFGGVRALGVCAFRHLPARAAAAQRDEIGRAAGGDLGHYGRAGDREATAPRPAERRHRLQEGRGCIAGPGQTPRPTGRPVQPGRCWKRFADGDPRSDQPEVRSRHGRARRVWLEGQARLGYAPAHPFPQLHHLNRRTSKRPLLTPKFINRTPKRYAIF
jgi:DNA polymerase V